MLKSIEFDNFKCLSDKSFDLSKVNVFSGYNGRGKSSVMQLILMLSQSIKKDDMNSIAHLHLNGDYVKLGDFDELLADTSDKLQFGVRMQLTSDRHHLVELAFEMTDDYKVGQLFKCLIDGEDYFDTVSSLPFGDQSSRTGQEGDLKQLPVFLYNHFFSQNVHYVAADRKGPVKFVERDEIPDFFSVGADGSRTINILSSYHEKVDNRMNVFRTDKTEYDLNTSVSLWVDYIMHGGSVKVLDGTIQTNDTFIQPKKSAILKLGFGMSEKGQTFPSYHVGFGYSYILSIIVTALIAKENDIVIIENPEAHLHPEAQARVTFLLARLASRGVQVFVETHSEHVINAFRLAALKDEYDLVNNDVHIFFFDSDFSIKSLHIEPNGRIPEWPSGFFDQYQKELAEILRLGAIVGKDGC